MKEFKIFVINPGSTSTKVALFENDDVLFQANVAHDANLLASFTRVTDQLPYRTATIDKALADAGIVLEKIDACVGRGGGLMPLEGGTYALSDLLLDHAMRGANGVSHPAQLGIPLAKAFADRLHCPVFTVNPPDVDEYEPVARITGIKGVFRQSHLHALNLKETAIHHAAATGTRYEEQNYIVCHIGGGVSISAHRKGRMVDGNDIVMGEGPMAPTRCGSVPVRAVIDLCTGGSRQMKELCSKSGGFISHLGTSDAREVLQRVRNGDQEATIVWDAMLYQIEKYIGAMAVVLKGNVDGILIGGGMAHIPELVVSIRESCGFLAPVYVYPGEFEMEAMSRGTQRVLSGQEAAKRYTGVPSWQEQKINEQKGARQ